MSSTLKSSIFSLAVHAGVFAVAYAVPTLSTERFRAAGSRQVVSIELSLSQPPTAASSAAEFEAVQEPPTAMETPPQELKPRELAIDRSAASTQPPESLPAPSVGLAPEVARRLADRQPMLAEPPAATAPQPLDLSPDRPPQPLQRSALSSASPAVAASVPIDQLAGLAEEKVAADLSQNRPPEYPAEAIREGLEGTVLLRLHVGEDGRVERVEIVRSSGHLSLDRAAIEAVSRWTGTPARRGDRPVATVELLPIRFRL